MSHKRKVLLLYPEFPPTYWGLQFSLPILGKKSFMPPLGLLTLAALSPPEFEFRLVDLNCEPLQSEDLEWADMVCISAMITQKHTMAKLGERCRAAGKLVVVGGPFPTSCPDECSPYCDVIVAGEAEVTWPLFLEDLFQGTLKAEYRLDEKPDLGHTPTPRFDLVKTEDYLTIPVQFSRGCPFQCEFCDIIVLFGRKPRTKTPEQIKKELSAVYNTGYRGDIFFVDDNFIGNKRKTKEIVATISEWNQEFEHPFEYATEASVDLAQQDELLAAMVAAKFRRVFLGIETPAVESLEETKKYQNLRNSLEESVNKIAGAGLNVMGGFIVGFDSDPEDIFERQLEFISRVPVPLSMVTLLEALPGTPLYKRIEAEGRLIPETGDLPPGRVGHSNIVPRGSRRKLLEGYRRLLVTVYSPQAYFARVLLANRVAPRPGSFRQGLRNFIQQVKMGLRYSTGIRSILRFLASLRPDFRREAARLFWRLLTSRPDRLGLFMDYLVVGNHMHRFTFDLAIPQIDANLEALALPAALPHVKARSASAEERRLPLAG